MKYIKITQNKLSIVDDEDYKYLIKHNWYYQQGKNKRIGYARGVVNGKKILMHRFILMNTFNLKTWDSKMQVDHINSNGIDNRKSNIRICTQENNQANRRKKLNKKSIYRGVHFKRNKDGKILWSVEFWKHKIKYKGGYFFNETEAANAADELNKTLNGKYARLNFNENS